jgi:hypothetical protein
MLAWHHGIHNLWTTLACAVLSKTCIDGLDITPEQQGWKYFIGTIIRELRVEILQALSKSVADLDPEQIEEFLQQCRFGDHVSEYEYPAKFIEYTKARQLPYYVHLARIISERFTHLLHQKKVIVYQHDVLNHDCASFASHYDSQQNIYDVARENTFLFKAVKTHLNYRKQKVLGHIVSKQGRTVDPRLERDIIALKPPHDLQGVQQLLGMVQQAREYIHELTHIVEPIQRLVRKDIDIPSNWGVQQDNAFELLKQKLTSAPYLLQPDLQKQFRIHVDACRKGRGIGAVLLKQDDNDNWRPVAY